MKYYAKLIVLALMLAVTACSGETETPNNSSGAEPTQEPPQQFQAPITDAVTEVAESSAESDARLLYDLLSDEQTTARAALDEILEVNDQRFMTNVLMTNIQ